MMDHFVLSSLSQLLQENAYPGRGIVLGLTPDGTRTAAAYFIMGRSANSRNRIFSPTADGIRTEAFDPAKVEDPSLIIYHPVRELGRSLIVTNGDQTDTVRDYLEQGLTFAQALDTRCFEPDGPNWTPRISGLLGWDGACRLSILKSADAAGSACVRNYFYYPPLPGVGHFLHTYRCDGSPIPSFVGEPVAVAMDNDIDAFGALLWESLNADNKVSLYVRYAPVGGGEAQVRIYNKHVSGGCDHDGI